MYIENLVLVYFRNYKETCIEPNKEMNIILGENAQGKSNLLEALFLFTTGKSFRVHREKDLIKWEEEFSRIIATITYKYREKVKITILLQNLKDSRRTSKTIKINNNIARSASNLVGTVNTVMFSPEDLEIVKGSPGNRRRFIDLEITQISPPYCDNLCSYHKALEQRNSLIRHFRDYRDESQLIDIWEEQLARYGTAIIAKRIEILNKLEELSQPIIREITSGKESLDLDYSSTVYSGETPIKKMFSKMARENFEKEIEKSFINNLSQNRNHDIKYGSTSIGPHRDDIHIMLNNKSARIFASQGQQRTVALALKLAEREVINSETGESPILLLDDVTAELDEKRSYQLLNYIKGKGQIFITQNRPSDYFKKFYQNASFFHITEGDIKVGLQN